MADQFEEILPTPTLADRNVMPSRVGGSRIRPIFAGQSSPAAASAPGRVVEHGARGRGRLDPDAAAEVLDDLPADGEAQTPALGLPVSSSPRS